MNEQRFPQDQDPSRFSFSMADHSHVDGMLPKDLRSHFWMLRDEVVTICQKYGAADPEELVHKKGITSIDLETCAYLMRSIQYMLEKKQLPPLFLKRESEVIELHYGEMDDEPQEFVLPAFIKMGTIFDLQGKFVLPGQMTNGRWVLLNHQGKTLGSPEGYDEMGPIMRWNQRLVFAVKEGEKWSVLDQYGATVLELSGYRQVMKMAEVDGYLFVFAQTKGGGNPWRLLNQFGEIKGEFQAIDEVSASEGRLAFVARAKEDWPNPSVWHLQKDGPEIRLQRIPLPTHTETQELRGYSFTQEPGFSHPEIKQVTCVGEDVVFGVREKGRKYWSVISSVTPQFRIMDGVELLAIRETGAVGAFRVAGQQGGEAEWFHPDAMRVIFPHCTELIRIFSRPKGEIFFSARFSTKSRLVFPARVDDILPMGRAEGYAKIQDIIRVTQEEIIFAAYEKKGGPCGIFDHKGVCLGMMDRVDALGALDDGRFYAIGRIGGNIVKHIFDPHPETT